MRDRADSPGSHAVRQCKLSLYVTMVLCYSIFRDNQSINSKRKKRIKERNKRMIVIKGYERKSGTFTPAGSNDGIAYDNVILHLINDEKIDGFNGARCEQLKVKTKDLGSLFGCSYEGLSMYLDTPITFNYAFRNGKANLVSVSVADSGESFAFES